MRLLADTNVLLDYLLRRPGFEGPMRRVFVMQFYGAAELWASAKSFTDVFYVARKAIGSARAQECMLSLLEQLHVCAIDGEDVRAAAQAAWPDFEDCLIARAAEKIGADAILTRDVRGFDRAAIPAQTPEELLDQVFRETGSLYDEIEFLGV